MAPELQVFCLGRLNLRCCETPQGAARELPLPATLKAQSLLAYLVVHQGRPQTRDHLAELFWGDRPEYNARRSLTTALWQIRRCLPSDDFIFADSAVIWFNPRSPFWLDVAEFELLTRTLTPSAPISALQQAMALYRGAFLDGFYDDWVLSERYRLEGLYCDTLARLMAAQETAGEHAAGLAAALQLLEHDPLREDAHRAAMRAYCWLGQRNAALAQYARCQQTLQAELGARPMAETTALRQAILEGRLACAAEPGAAAVPVRPRPRAQHPLDAAGQIPLVGREQELAFLADGWEAAQGSGCHLLLISGEAGVGKTRLVQEFADQQRWQGMRILQGRCYEFERLLPYQPVAEALRAIAPDVAAAAFAAIPGWAAAQVGRLAPELMETSPQASLPATSSGQMDMRRAASLPMKKPNQANQGDLRTQYSEQALAGEGRAPPSSLRGKGAEGVGPPETQEWLFEAISCFLAQLTNQAPLLLILEDLHWASDSTLQLLHYLARSLAGHPLLIVGTLRSEAIPAAHPLATLGRRLERDGLARRLTLSPLSAAAVAELIGQMSGQGAAAAPLAERLYRETEGNPFYLIQTIKALFQQGAIRVEGGAWRADYAALGRGQLPLPASVSETIAARVGRLSQAAQDAVQVASVAGREFDFDLLNGAWGKGEEATLAALDDLMRQRLIGEGVGAADYAFTHHKIREVVYAGLARHRRLRLHGEVGLALERCLGAGAGARAAELAMHFEQARQFDAALTDKSLAYLLQAGQQAERQSAHREAIAYFQRGLAILHALPETSQRLRQEVELQIALAVPTTVIHGYASTEAKHVYDQANALCRQAGDTPALFTALAGLSRYYGLSGNTQLGFELAEQMYAIAEATQDTALQLETYRAIGGTAFGLGRLKEAQAFWERGIALYDLGRHERQAYRFGHDPAVAFHGYLSLTRWLLGYPDQAAAQCQRLTELLRSWSHPSSLVLAHCWLAKMASACRDAQIARRHAEEVIRLSQANEMSGWTAMGVALLGWALVQEGQAAEGLARLNEGIAGWRATGFAHFAPFFLALQAEACLQMGRLPDGLAAVAAAETIADRGGDRYWLAEQHRLRGELIWAQVEDAANTEAHFRQALETARQQEAKMLELRAAVSLARLWGRQDRAPAARELLAAIYGWFTEGFETPDLCAARALLAEL